MPEASDSRQSDDSPPTAVTTELVRVSPPSAAPGMKPAAPGAELLDRAPERDEGLPGLEPERSVTDWGRSERIAGLADATLLSFLYNYWFRLEAEGVENVPPVGGVLLVANRAGRLPLDGAMIAKAVRDEHPRGRVVHLASTRSFAQRPGVGMLATKLGAVEAHPANLHRLLLDEGQAVLVFPEGERAPAKPLRARYRLRRFDAVDFVTAASRARVPIVPVAVVGAEEATPTLASLAPLGRLRMAIGAPLPLPAKFRLRFLQPVRTDELQPDDIEGGRVQELAEAVRTLLQENLFDMVAHRRSIWLG